MTDQTRQDQHDPGREPRPDHGDSQDREREHGHDHGDGQGHEHTRAQARGEKRGGLWAGVREVLWIGATALVISFLIKTFIAQAFWIPSGSMENTLVYGDRVMVSKIQAGPMTVERGDLVVFEDPGDWLSPRGQVERGPVMETVVKVLQFVGVAPVAEGNHLIKRTIGVGGDTVACCDDDGRMTVNGQPLEEDYLYPGDQASLSEFEVTVPEDSIWVMGDHRSNSQDSRAHDDGTGLTGSVPRDKVVGQAFVLLFPLDHLTWFRTPATFESIPEPSGQ
ncbi:signal peptidase I [Ornithinimicrobium panacihumi]|uniref:signal peptidase I n=1 Tax=Ornithinimicrobium panacihumi TaxID=2008449 RepID=UPI003F8BAEAC